MPNNNGDDNDSSEELTAKKMDSVLNRVSFFEKSQEIMQSKIARTPPRKKETKKKEDPSPTPEPEKVPEKSRESSTMSRVQQWESRASGNNETKKGSFSGTETSSSANRDISLGFSGTSASSSSEDTDEQEVLMHSMTNDDDIPLEELFSNAASLNVRLETANSANSPPQKLFSKDGEEIVENTKKQDENKESPIAEPTAVRTVLYDSDDDEMDVESGQGLARYMPAAGFMAIPYSNGKRKKDADGMSVVSDDISIAANVGILNTKFEMLRYTVPKPDYKEYPPDNSTERKYKVIIMLCCVLLIGVISVIIGLLASRRPEILPSPVVTTAPMTAPSSPITQKPSLAPVDMVLVEEGPSLPPVSVIPVAKEPSLAPVGMIPVAKEPPVEIGLPPIKYKFKNTATIVGQADGDRLGSVISMSSDGTFLAALSNTPNAPVQTFQRDENSGDWVPTMATPVDNATISTNTSLAFGSDISSATIPEDGTPVLAISSQTQVQVYQLVGRSWVNRGQPILWDVDTVAYSAMTLSSDASTLAMGCVDDNGVIMSVQIYRYDLSSKEWTPIGGNPLLYDAQNRHVGGNQRRTLLSISLALSRNGSVLSVKEWAVADPQVVVQTFGFKDLSSGRDDHSGSWEAMGGQLMHQFGPASVALSEDGYTLAVVATHPGEAVVYRWIEGYWKKISGDANHGYLPSGGSSVSLARNGSRILIGNLQKDEARIYDYSNNETWLRTTTLWGSGSSGFGTSVAMDESGSTLGIGAPSLSSRNGNNLGQVRIYS
ncbi:unnamed protein product [Pseudo-nitzschia multistriata]|uniref:Uncharacterized protein n=1 Tax=Pseudo-nitzschia multistriata TaxID=183589 RepID=A0A448ZLR1_9STRA|nr:unnamed protein product [Pseudo-nitzschia multistriata]